MIGGAGSKQTGGVGCCSSGAQRCSQHRQLAISLTVTLRDF